MVQMHTIKIYVVEENNPMQANARGKKQFSNKHIHVLAKVSCPNGD